jgi:hypothetical protein
MNTNIKQITEEEVIPAIVNNDLVVRVNLDKMVCCDLARKSIATIRNDFDKANYIYFVVENIK